MIPRYANADVTRITSDLEKLLKWQRVELAAIKARVRQRKTTQAAYDAIRTALEANPPDVAWWKARDAEISHDLLAFIDERRRFIPVEFQSEFHKGMTSYDTEEPAHALTLLELHALVEAGLRTFDEVIDRQKLVYENVIFLDRTHGQGAKLRSFGGRFKNWQAALDVDRLQLGRAIGLCQYSRMSGAIGNFGSGLNPLFEAEALGILGLMPFPGATQIMPREIYVPLAQALANLCRTLGKVAGDVRLSARSGFPLCHEPFGKSQKGSSAMPHKKNTILTEQMTGMVRMATRFEVMIADGIDTWEARSIEQSCVERVAWPDLFHVTLRMLSVMTKVLDGLVVYQDNMLREIVESRGTYASEEAKSFLAERVTAFGKDAEIAYRIVQLAAFNVLEPKGFWAEVRNQDPAKMLLDDADGLLNEARKVTTDYGDTIETVIASGALVANQFLGATHLDVAAWNSLLQEIFQIEADQVAWSELFKPSNLLKYESHLIGSPRLR